MINFFLFKPPLQIKKNFIIFKDNFFGLLCVHSQQDYHHLK